MPLRNYTTLKPEENMINPFLEQIKNETNITYEAKFVEEMKYWAFPKGVLYLLFHKKGSEWTYLTFLNTPYKMSFIGSRKVPYYLTSHNIDYLYLN